MTYLLAASVIAICFIGIGVGILFFGRKSLGGECGKDPTQRKGSCLSKDVGLCPLEDKEGYLKMAQPFRSSK